MVRVCNGIGKVIQQLLWGSNRVCTKPNRSYGMSTPVRDVSEYRKSLICNGVPVHTVWGWILGHTLCPPHRSAIPVGTSLNFFLTFLYFFRKGNK